MTQVKPFQQATVDAALRNFRSRRRYRRFLVADEVGLGKTIVAQQIIRELMKRRSTPLVVIYVCSNLSIATQNQRKLLEVLPPDERKSAYSPADRLALLAGGMDRPTHPRLNLYSLTPDTSIPMRKNRRRDGRQDERAQIHVLMEQVFPTFFNEWPEDVFQRNAWAYWDWYVDRAREKVRIGAVRDAFRRSVREEFRLAKGEHLLRAIRHLDDLQLIGHLRNSLAASAIEDLNPDLVIFDEFQRFRDLVSVEGDEDDSRVASHLRGEGVTDPPSLLLLSATPYRLYARRSEDPTGSSHHDEFFELVEFLYGNTGQGRESKAVCREAFAELEIELRKREPTSQAALAARDRIQEALSPVMARTERASHRVSWEERETESIAAPVISDDLLVFKHTGESFQGHHRSATVPYWTSIPLPMQTMGRQYEAWKAAEDADTNDAPALDKEMRDEFQCLDPWPHPRLRALRKFLPPSSLVAPWIAPSLPWWKLQSPWGSADKQPRKALLFSRFRAVPQAVGAAISFDLESTFIKSQKLPYTEVTKRRLLSATEARQALLALFHPSPIIVKWTDPLAAGNQSISSVRSEVLSQVRQMLASLGIKEDASAPRRPLWKLIAGLEFKAGNWEFIEHDWWQLNAEIQTGEDEEGGLAQLLGAWDKSATKELSKVHPSSVKLLSRYALSAPGVVVGRALQRHWSEATTEQGFSYTLDATWNGLRNYLDQRWFYSAFGQRKEKYPQVIQRLVIDGNLESVLDEHLWITSRLRSLSGHELAEDLRDGLSIKNGLFFLHELGNKTAERFSLRCHVAMPFVEARAAYAHNTGEEGTEKVRTDELRKAFNTPFWPHVLTTTSVGQEGLDFHAWCDTIIHWDLCRNPVDLEQREGRIRRFGGLSIRQAVISELGDAVWEQRGESESPWAAAERVAEEKLADASGLVPWWVCKGGNVRRCVFDVPTSEQRHWVGWLHEQRLLYRLALGQPNQEDLLEVLAEGDIAGSESMRDAAINLSPWFGNGGNSATE